jgi:hypothetical protein
MNDPNIALGIRQPEPANPLATIGALQQIRSSQIENQLRTQQIATSQIQQQDIQAQVTQRNRDLADQNLIEDTMKNPDFATAIGKGDLSSLAGRVQPKTFSALQTQVLAQQNAISAKSKADLDLHTEQLGQISSGLTGLKLLAADHPDQLPAAYAQWRNTAIGAKIVGPDTLPAQIASAADLDNIGGITGAFLGMHQAVQAAATAKQAEKTSAATATKDVSQGKEADAATALSTFKLGLMRDGANPATLGAKVDALIDPVKYPQANRDARAAGALAAQSGDPAKIGEAVQHVYDQQVGDIAKAKALVPVEVAKSVATARATAPVEIQRAVDTQIALAKNSPDAFAGIVDPFARHQAMTQYAADSKEYADSVAASRQLGDLITAAQGGNKAAPGVIPIQELRGFVNRVNATELRAVSSGAGSLLDKLQGFVNGAAEGQPIPPDILAATKQIADLQERAAVRKYDLKLQFIRQQGGKVEGIKLPDSQQASYQKTAKDASGHEIGTNDNWATYYDTATGKKLSQ